MGGCCESGGDVLVPPSVYMPFFAQCHSPSPLFLNPDRRRWLDMRTIYPYPPGRQLHAAAALPDETMWVVGGIGDKPLTDVWVFDAR